MGYRPNRNARGLITGQSGSIGLVVPDLENPYFGSVCKGVQERARASGYSVFIADTDEDPSVESEVVRTLSKQVDGVILCSSRMDDDELLRLATPKPAVLANRELAELPSIVFDNGGGMRMAIRHLASLGHSRIAYAGGPRQSWSNGRRRSALKRFGDENKGLELVQLGDFSPTFGGGVVAADLAIASGATAVIAYNDLIALGMMDRLGQRGVSVPDQLSVVGFDNVPVSTFVRPNLTTVSLPRVQMGRMSVDLLLDILSGSQKPPRLLHHELPVDLVVRHSSGVAAASLTRGSAHQLLDSGV